MKRWKSWLEEMWKRRSIKNQILISMLICLILAVALVGCMTFIFSKGTMERNYQNSHRYNLEVSGSIIDIQLQNLVDLSRTLLYNQNFKKIFTKEQKKSTYFSSRDDIVLNHTLRDLAEQNKYIQSTVAIHKKGNIYFYSKLTQQNGKMLKYHKDEDILAMDWVAVADREMGKEVFYGYNVLFDDNNETFSMVKTLKNTETGEDMGYVVINIKKSMFLSAFGKGDEGYVTNRYMIFDKNESRSVGKPDWNLVYFHGGTDVKQEVLKDYISGATGKYLFSEVHNEKGDWEVVNVIAKEELSRDSNYIAWISVLVCIAMLIICCLFVNGISKVITLPLEQLKKNIDLVSKGTLRIEEEFDQTEIGKIGTQFKNTVNNNLDLHEKLLHSEIKEKEAELLLLQSQINPHFLYNTLDSLYFMAVIEHADEIADMVLALSDTFKLSLNRGEKLIEVGDEIEKIKAYMKLQNMRYHNRFELKLEIEESLISRKILTFILQPVVENAVYHGLEPKLGGGCSICLSGCQDGNFMVFKIKDNGVGIVNMSLLDEGYGVKNIRERLSLFYGDEAGICFESEAGAGTEVTLRVPLHAEKEGE
ncbi:MAG: sensor histidine kinase [Lacrimispora sp.]